MTLENNHHSCLLMKVKVFGMIAGQETRGSSGSSSNGSSGIGSGSSSDNNDVTEGKKNWT